MVNPDETEQPECKEEEDSSMLRPEVEKATCWGGLRCFYDSNLDRSKTWIFRGDSGSKPALRSSLEKTLLRFGRPSESWSQWETNLVREFRRHYHRYSGDSPGRDTLEWLSIMQHFGAPTRLMDWTYSFWVAVFFALARAEPDKTYTVWAMDRDGIKEKLVRRFRDRSGGEKEDGDASECRKWECHAKAIESGTTDPSKISRLFSDSLGLPGLFFANPFRLNARLAIQQGLFVAPLDVSRSFEENVMGCVSQDELENVFWRLDIGCDVDALKEVFEELHRMNINQGTLFPDLSGFAEGLKHRLALDEFYQGVDSISTSIWEPAFFSERKT